MSSSPRSPLRNTIEHAPVVICIAPNGARKSKHDHSHLPLTSSEIAEEARLCMAAGATAIHLHVRDATGQHSLDSRLYQVATDAIHRATDAQMVVQITTEACGVYSPEQQIGVVREVRPEAASVAIRELVPDDRSVSEAQRFFSWACERGIGLQYVVYDDVDLQRAIELKECGVIPNELPHLLLVLGRYTKDMSSDPADLAPLLKLLPPAWPWSLCAFGLSESRCMASAVQAGGHCRVGFENNMHLEDGRTAESNADLVASTREVIARSTRAVGTIRDARALFVG